MTVIQSPSYYGIEYSMATVVAQAAQKSDIAKVAKLALQESNLGLENLKQIREVFNKKYKHIKAFGKKIEIPVLGSLANSIYMSYYKTTIGKLEKEIKEQSELLNRLTTSNELTSEVIKTVLKTLSPFQDLGESELTTLSVFISSRTPEKVKELLEQAIKTRDFSPFTEMAHKMQGRLALFRTLLESPKFQTKFSPKERALLTKLQKHINKNELEEARELVEKESPGTFKNYLAAYYRLYGEKEVKNTQTTTDFVVQELYWLKDSDTQFNEYEVTTAICKEFERLPHMVLRKKVEKRRASDEDIVLVRDQGVQYQYTVSKDGSLLPQKGDAPREEAARFFLVNQLLNTKNYSAIQSLFRFEESRYKFQNAIAANKQLQLVSYFNDLIKKDFKDPSAILVQLRACAIQGRDTEEVNKLVKKLGGVNESTQLSFFLTPQEAELLDLPEKLKKVVTLEHVNITTTPSQDNKEQTQQAGTDSEPARSKASFEIEEQFKAALTPQDQVKKELTKVEAELTNIYRAIDTYKSTERPALTTEEYFQSIDEAKDLKSKRIEANALLTKTAAEFEEQKARLYGKLYDLLPEGSPPPPLEAIYFAFVQNDLGKLAPRASKESLNSFIEPIKKLLGVHQKLQKAERIAASLKEKIPDDLQQQLASKPEYDAAEHPHFQVFEVLLNIFMRKEQVENIQRLLNQQSTALQMLMGGGKTAVLLPMIALMKADGNTLSTVMLPDAILSSEGGKLRDKLGGFFERFVYEFPEMKVGATTEELKEIHKHLKLAQKHRGCVFMTPARKHAFLNNTKWILDQYNQLLTSKQKDPKFNEKKQVLEAQLQAASEIWLLMKQHEAVIGDELDDLLKTSLQFIISLGSGEEEPFPESESLLIAELVKHVATKKELQLDFFPDVKDAKPLSEEEYDKNVLPELIDLALSHLKETSAWQSVLTEHKREIKTYLSARYIDYPSAKEAQEYVSTLPTSLRDQLAGLRSTLLTNLLSSCNSHYNSDYGLADAKEVSKDGKSPQIAIPYAGPNKPSETRFSSPHQLIVKTVQAYIKKGMKGNQLDNAIKKFCEKSVKKPTENIKSTSQSLFMSSKTFSGITGTMWNITTMPKFADIKRDNYMEGKNFDTLFSKAKSGDIAMEAIENTSTETLIAQIKKHKAKAFIDVGGWLRNDSEEEFANKILDSDKGETFDYVVFHSDKGEKIALDQKTRQRVPFDPATMPPSHRFTIYSKAYTTGTDITQEEEARGLLTVGKDNIARDTLQGAYRMRKLLDKQKLTVLSDPETRLAMSSAGINMADSKAPTFAETMAFLFANQVDRVLDDNYGAAHQRTETYMEMALLEKILSNAQGGKFADAIDLYKDQRQFFVGGEGRSAWEQFGEIPTRLDAQEKIEKDLAHKKQLIDKLKLPSGIAKEIEGCFSNKALFKDKLDSIEKPHVATAVYQQVATNVQEEELEFEEELAVEENIEIEAEDQLEQEEEVEVEVEEVGEEAEVVEEAGIQEQEQLEQEQVSQEAFEQFIEQEAQKRELAEKEAQRIAEENARIQERQLECEKHLVNIRGTTNTERFDNFLIQNQVVEKAAKYNDAQLERAIQQLQKAKETLQGLNREAEELKDNLELLAEHRDICKTASLEASEIEKTIRERLDQNQKAQDLLVELQQIQQQAADENFQALATAINQLQKNAQPVGLVGWALGSQQLTAEEILAKGQQLKADFTKNLQAKQERKEAITKATAQLDKINNILLNESEQLTSAKQSIANMLDSNEEPLAITAKSNQAIANVLEACDLEDLDALVEQLDDAGLQQQAAQVRAEKRGAAAVTIQQQLQAMYGGVQAAQRAGIQQLLQQVTQAAQESNLAQLQGLKQQLATLQNTYIQLENLQQQATQLAATALDEDTSTYQGAQSLGTLQAAIQELKNIQNQLKAGLTAEATNLVEHMNMLSSLMEEANRAQGEVSRLQQTCVNELQAQFQRQAGALQTEINTTQLHALLQAQQNALQQRLQGATRETIAQLQKEWSTLQQAHQGIMQQIAQRQDQAAGLLQNIAALQSQGLNLQQIDSSIKNWIDTGEGASLAECESQILEAVSSNQNLQLLQNINQTGLAANITATLKARVAHLERQEQLQAACRLAQQELDKLRTQGQALEQQLQNMMQGDFQLDANVMQTTINIEQVAENKNLEAYQAALEQAQQKGQMQLEAYSAQLKELQQRYQQAAKLYQNLQGIFTGQNLQPVKVALQHLNIAEASRELQLIVQQTDDIAQLRQLAIFAEDFGVGGLVEARIATIEAAMQAAEAQQAMQEARQQMVTRVTGMEQRLNQANVTGNLLNYKNVLLDKLNTIAHSENIAERHKEISALDKEIDYLLQVQEELQNTLSTEIDGLSAFLRKEEDFAKMNKNAKFAKGNKVAIEFSKASTEINKQIERYNKAKQKLVKGSTTIATGKDLKNYANECQGLNKMRQGVERQIQQGLKKLQ